jgi:hypothetical protein
MGLTLLATGVTGGDGGDDVELKIRQLPMRSQPVKSRGQNQLLHL